LNLEIVFHCSVDPNEDNRHQRALLRPKEESFPSEAMVRITTDDEDIEGNCLIDSIYFEELVRRFAAGSSSYLADAWNVGKETFEKLVGADPLDREKIEKSWSSQYFWSPLNNSISCVLNECLWDIAGKMLRLPVYRLLGANREKILAYASTQFYNDEKDYLDLLVKLKDAGYKAIKLHPHRDWERDILLCRRVREIVGDKMILMLDPLNAYTRDQALSRQGDLESGFLLVRGSHNADRCERLGRPVQESEHQNSDGRAHPGPARIRQVSQERCR
jgi:L-alanine-DL-glutamate epimerase-like enolase superfamily enzyme